MAMSVIIIQIYSGYSCIIAFLLCCSSLFLYVEILTIPDCHQYFMINLSFYLSLFLCFLKPDHPPAAQWQLDKWLKKSRKKCASTEQNPSQTIPGRLHSPHTHRAPSPARSFDSNQEYSPSQSPIPSPQFSYSNNNSPLPSPGYSYCPSPSPFTSTCQSPSPSPRHSPIPSPVLSICPSPCGTLRDSRSPSPIARDPPRSPSPSIPAPSRVCHYPEFQSQNQPQPSQSTNSHRIKIRPWIAPVSDTNTNIKSTSNTHLQPSHKHRPKTRPPQDQGQSQTKSKASVILTSSQNQSHTSRPKPNFYPSSKQLADVSQTRNTSQLAQIQGSRSSHKPRPPFQPNSQHSPTRAKHLVPTAREINPLHNSQSTSRAASNPGCGPNSQSIPGLKKHRSKSWEATAPTTVNVNHAKTTPKKPQTKKQEVERRRDHLTTGEGRKHERKEDRQKEKQQGKQEQKEDRRLAEEQLLRRSWIQSSAEEEEGEEEEGVTEQDRRREETAREESRRKREAQQQRHKWEAKHKVPTNHSHQQGGTKKRGRSEEERQFQPDPSPPSSSRSPTPQRTSSSFSSSSSSSSDSESEFQAPITKVPADSTSQRKLAKPGQQGPGRPDASRPKVVQQRQPSSGNPSEDQQSAGKQKLYTLVPFGRGNKAAPHSQRGLRNLVVHIDLCLLKRVPDTATQSTPKKTSSSSSSLSAKDKQIETMKHLHVPETQTKDSTRKRKVDSVSFHSLPNVTCMSTEME